MHEEWGDETDDTGLRGVTLGESLHETAALLLNLHVSLSVSESFFRCFVPCFLQFGEGNDTVALLLLVLHVPVLDFIVRRVEEEIGGGREGEGLDELSEEAIIDVVIGLLDLIRLAILALLDFLGLDLNFFLERLPVGLSVDNISAHPHVGNSHSVLSECASLV